MRKKKSKTEKELNQLVANAIASCALLNEAMMEAGVKRSQRRQILRAVQRGVVHVANGSASETS